MWLQIESNSIWVQAKQKEADQATSKAKAAEASLQDALLRTEKGDALSSTLTAVRKVTFCLMLPPNRGCWCGQWV